ncbi:MAG TPA: DNA modification methylase [Thermotogota bacterium]|nr:DNA modification methylase [Thermotogota bacterium]
MNLSDIKANSKNPRIIKDEAFKKLCESIKRDPEFMTLRPIVVDDEGIILGGNMRYRAIKELGMKDVPDGWIVKASNLTAEQRKRFILVDNAPRGMAGDWDFDMLANEWELSELKALGFDLADFGMDLDMNTGLTDEDDVPETPEEPITKAGDLWILGDHRLLCGNSTKREDVERLMDGKKANLVVTDPPYNVNYEGSAGKIKNDNMANDAFYSFLLAAFQNTEAVMADDASIYVFHSDIEGLNFRRAFSDAGFYLSGCCIWKKQSLVLGRSPYQWQHEPVLYGWKKSGKHQWYSGRKETTIWEFDKPKKNGDHPTMKPIPLLAYPIMNSSMSNTLVLDPFGGSGSTLIACEQLNRKCYMMELDAGYCDVIVKRWEDFAGRKATRE